MRKRTKSAFAKQCLQDKVFDIVNILIMAILTFIFVWPLIFVLSASVSDPAAVTLGKVWLFPKNKTFMAALLKRDLLYYILSFRNAQEGVCRVGTGKKKPTPQRKKICRWHIFSVGRSGCAARKLRSVRSSPKSFMQKHGGFFFFIITCRYR